MADDGDVWVDSIESYQQHIDPEPVEAEPGHESTVGKDRIKVLKLQKNLKSKYISHLSV